MRYLHISKEWQPNPLWKGPACAMPQWIVKKGDGKTFRDDSQKSEDRAARRAGKISARQQRMKAKQRRQEQKLLLAA